MTSLFHSCINLHNFFSIDFSSDNIFFFIKAYVNERKERKTRVNGFYGWHENADNKNSIA